MKQDSWCLAVIAVVILAVALAGCTMLNSSGNIKSSSGSGNSGSAAAGGSAAAASGGVDCPAVTATNSWAGKWNSLASTDRCMDLRKAFYPPSQDTPNQWEFMTGWSNNMSITITQTGCDVTASVINNHDQCPITLTGTVKKDNELTGTWKAYCNIRFNGAETADDGGKFSLWMEPGGSTFIGSFQGDNPGIADYFSRSCPGANSNWVGKRA